MTWSRILTVFLTFVPLLAGAPQLNSLFSDHMVLQRGIPASVWGSAKPGEQVTISFGGATERTTADAAGRWRVTLPAHAAGGPLTLTAAGETTVTVRDVLVGEVWIASGQSNMAFALSRATGARQDIATAEDPKLRLLTVPKATALEPLSNVKASWTTVASGTVSEFSAVAYYFGRELRRRLHVPVGIIHTSWPGTQAEEWTPLSSLNSDPDLSPIVARWSAHPTSAGTAGNPAKLDLQFAHFALVGNSGEGTPVREATWTYTFDSAPQTAWESTGGTQCVSGQLYASDTSQLQMRWNAHGEPADLAGYSALRFRLKGTGVFRIHFIQPSITDWDNYATGVIEARSEWSDVTIPFASLKQAGWGRKAMFTPRASTGIVIEPLLGADAARPPAGLYNGMIAPLLPYAIRGAIWYQGEGNAGRAWQYRKLLPAMITSWRRSWGQGDFPLLIVQLPNFRERRAEPSGSDWAELREAQLMTLHLPNTGMAVTIDLGEAGDVHPSNKKPVAERLVHCALGTVYGAEKVYSGPIYRSMTVDGANAVLTFEHPGSGLTTTDAHAPRGFAIAGADRKFVWADARIDGDRVIVSSPAISKPAAVRYAWADNPDCNLENREGLLASPFRTDDWPGVTDGRR